MTMVTLWCNDGIVCGQQQSKCQWRCVLCQKRREYACMTGEWFHGQEAQPALNGRVFQRKLSDICSGTESDWVSICHQMCECPVNGKIACSTPSAISVYLCFVQCICAI